MSCLQCRRPSLNAKKNAESRGEQAKALRDALYKMSDTLVGSLVVVTVVDPNVQASSSKATFDPEFDQCHECEPEDEPTTASPASTTDSGTSSAWSSTAT